MPTIEIDGKIVEAKSTRSRGRQGPSQRMQTSSAQSKVSRPRRRRRRRQTGRTRRRKMASRNKNTVMEAPGSTFGQFDMALAPAAIGTQIGSATFARAGAAPRHKEWGAGCRYYGTNIYAQIVATNSSSTCIQIGQSRFATYASGLIFYDPFAALAPVDPYDGSVVRTSNQVFSLHPVFISDRLGREVGSWGRYVYRGLEFFYFPQTGSDDSNSISIGITHDFGWGTNFDQRSVTQSAVMGLGTAMSSSVWRAFSLRMEDYRGDRTYSTVLPTFWISTATGVVNTTAGTFMDPYLENTQYIISGIQNKLPLSSYTQGVLYVRYVIDFYSPVDNSLNRSQPVGLPFVVLTSASTSTTSTSTALSLPRSVPATPHHAVLEDRVLSAYHRTLVDQKAPYAEVLGRTFKKTDEVKETKEKESVVSRPYSRLLAQRVRLQSKPKEPPSEEEDDTLMVDNVGG